MKCDAVVVGHESPRMSTSKRCLVVTEGEEAKAKVGVLESGRGGRREEGDRWATGSQYPAGGSLGYDKMELGLRRQGEYEISKCR